MDIQLIDERVKKAYDRYLEKKNSHINELALTTLNDFHKKIEKWTGDPDNLNRISFFRNFLYGDHMEAISSSGSTTATHANFSLVMGKIGTVMKIAELFCLRRDNPIQEGIVKNIASVDFINHVINNPAVEGAKPLIFTNRFLLSIFVEIMTSIADRDHLDKTAKLLGIGSPKSVSFEKLQVQVRNIVEESLIRQDIGNELTKFTRAAIAYHIKEACK